MVKTTQSKPAKKHHFVPQLYLSGFTDLGAEAGLLYAHDLDNLRTWKAKTNNVAFENDFYRIDLPGVDVDEIEKSFWPLEGEAARVLKEIIRLDQLPTQPEDYNMLMHFIGTLLVRPPVVRERIEKQRDEQLRKVLRLHAQLPDDQLEARLVKFRVENPEMPEVTPEDFRNFISSDEYSIEFARNYHIKHLVTGLLPAAEQIVPLLAARHWVLWKAQNGEHFITSDNPVTLKWTTEMPPAFAQSPGFAFKNTVVIFPLSKTLALWGRFEGPQGIVIPALNGQVALVNRIITQKARRFVYSTYENFVWTTNNGTDGDRRDMFDAIREFQTKRTSE